jgi:hypothetical protein
LIGQQAKRNRSDKVMATLGPCKSNPRWKTGDKKHEETVDGFHRIIVTKIGWVKCDQRRAT